MTAAIVTEFVMTFMFMLIILGSTDEKITERICRHTHRICTDTDPSGQYSGYQYFRKSGQKYQSGIICG